MTNPTRFSNQYFRLLLSLPWKPRVWDGPRQFAAKAAGKDLMMLPSDMALTEDGEMRKWVEIYAKDKVRPARRFVPAAVDADPGQTSLARSVSTTTLQRSATCAYLTGPLRVSETDDWDPISR